MIGTACHSQAVICAGDRCEAVQRLVGRWKLSRQMKDAPHQVEMIWKKASYANINARIWICCRVNSVYQLSLRLLSLRRMLMLQSQHLIVLQKKSAREIHLENSASKYTAQKYRLKYRLHVN